MKKYIVKTVARMEQTYSIEAENESEAKAIALSNIKDVVDQTQVDEGEILSIEEAGEVE